MLIELIFVIIRLIFVLVGLLIIFISSIMLELIFICHFYYEFGFINVGGFIFVEEVVIFVFVIVVCFIIVEAECFVPILMIIRLFIEVF
jgi:hypothetical protein